MVFAVGIEAAVGEIDVRAFLGSLDQRRRLSRQEGLPVAILILLEENGDFGGILTAFVRHVGVVAVGNDEEAENHRAFGDILGVDPDFLVVVALDIILKDVTRDRIAVRVGKINAERVVESGPRHDVGNLDMQFLGAFRIL